jgi:hypothetical protein
LLISGINLKALKEKSSKLSEEQGVEELYLIPPVVRANYKTVDFSVLNIKAIKKNGRDCICKISGSLLSKN